MPDSNCPPSHKIYLYFTGLENLSLLQLKSRNTGGKNARIRLLTSANPVRISNLDLFIFKVYHQEMYCEHLKKRTIKKWQEQSVLGWYWNLAY